MVADTRHKDARWRLSENPTFDGAQLAVLMDIRDELKHLNATLDCHNFQRIPITLRSILRKLPVVK